jgi:alpha-L-fucosidase 2
MEFKKLLVEKRAKLYPLKIDKRGRIQELYKDFEETDTLHRHVSHLFGLHPRHRISQDTPDIFQAAKRRWKYAVTPEQVGAKAGRLISGHGY